VRALLVTAMLAAFPATAVAGEKMRVLVPDDDNLQYMAFWLAKGAGYFEQEGLEVELVVPPAPRGAPKLFVDHQADAAVLPPPMYLELIAAKVPIVLAANLLKNDPIELVVRRSVLADRKLSDALPLRDRLLGLRGIRLGVAPHPPTRLRALFSSQGLEAEAVLSLVILHGNEQNDAFRQGKVDALYAHTPFVEQAIVHDDAVVLVNQSGGEVSVLKDRQIHVFAFERRFLDAHREDAVAAVRAIARAERLVHASAAQSVDVLARAFPARDRRELEKIVALYTPAIPDVAEVDSDKIQSALAFFPDGMKKPDLSGVDLAAYVDTSIAERANSLVRPSWAGARAWWMWVGALGAALLGAVAVRGARKANGARR